MAQITSIRPLKPWLGIASAEEVEVVFVVVAPSMARAADLLSDACEPYELPPTTSFRIVPVPLDREGVVSPWPVEEFEEDQEE